MMTTPDKLDLQNCCASRQTALGALEMCIQNKQRELDELMALRDYLKSANAFAPIPPSAELALWTMMNGFRR